MSACPEDQHVLVDDRGPRPPGSPVAAALEWRGRKGQPDRAERCGQGHSTGHKVPDGFASFPVHRGADPADSAILADHAILGKDAIDP